VSLTTDPQDPRLGHGVDTEPSGQNETYLVLSEAERKKGFVRPLYRAYIHHDPDAASQGLPACLQGQLTGINLVIVPDFQSGEWELREDGKVKASGYIDVPPWVTRPVEFDIEPPSFSVISRMWPYGSFPINRPMTLLGSIC
jgi:hypothetical protein